MRSIELPPSAPKTAPDDGPHPSRAPLFNNSLMRARIKRVTENPPFARADRKAVPPSTIETPEAQSAPQGRHAASVVSSIRSAKLPRARGAV